MIMPDGEWVWTPHLFYAYTRGQMPHRKTKSQTMGTLFHALAEGVPPKVIVSPVSRRGTKEWDKWLKAEAESRNTSVLLLEAEYTIIKENEDRKILDMYEAMMNNRIVADMLQDETVAVEGTVRWEQSGLKLQARPDHETQKWIIDYKTAAEPENFLLKAYELSYHRQAAMQIAGVHAVTGKKKPMRHIVVGSERPHDVIVYELPPNAIALGNAELSEIYQNIRNWTDFNVYESPWNTRVVTSDFPAWVYKGKLL
jgi:hypothetical protein